MQTPSTPDAAFAALTDEQREAAAGAVLDDLAGHARELLEHVADYHERADTADLSVRDAEAWARRIGQLAGVLDALGYGRADR